MPIINITTDIVFILLHFFALLFSYQVTGKKYFQPAVLFSLVWLGILILHFVLRFTLLNKLESLHINVYLIFFIGNLFFIAGSVLANFSFEHGVLKRMLSPSQQLPPSLPSFRLRVIATTIIFAGLPFYIQAAFKIFLASQAENFFSGLRYELSYGDADIGPLKYLMPLAYVVFSFNLYTFYLQRNPVNKALLIITLLLLVTYAVFATGRTYFLMILSIYAGISFFVNSKFSIKKYLLAFVIFFLLFIGVGIIYGKGGSTEDSFQENVQSSTANAGIYLVTSLNALEIETSGTSFSMEHGDNTLRFFIKIGMQLNLIQKRKVNELVQEFVFVPYATNVFTFYSPYIRDFGRIYAWLMLAFFGVLHTWLFNRSFYLKNMRSVFYYSFLLFPLFLSFFADQYLSLFSFWFQMFFFTELLIFINGLLASPK